MHYLQVFAIMQCASIESKFRRVWTGRALSSISVDECRGDGENASEAIGKIKISG